MWPKRGRGGCRFGFKEKRESCWEPSGKTDIPCLRTHPPRSLSPLIVSHTECAAAGRHSRLRTWPPSFPAEKSQTTHLSRIKSALRINWMNEHFLFYPPPNQWIVLSTSEDRLEMKGECQLIGMRIPVKWSGDRLDPQSLLNARVWSPRVCLVPRGNPPWTRRQGGDQVRVCARRWVCSGIRSIDSYGLCDLDVMKLLRGSLRV